jgi:ABC-type dipeptide/oligopeptide/nickel transport system ATPase component
VRVRLSSLTLKDGSSVELADPGVTVVVGPNDSGKTLLLREIMNLLMQQGQATELFKILSDVDIRKEGSDDELMAWLEEQGFAHPRFPQMSLEKTYRRGYQRYNESMIRQTWNRPGGLGALHDLLVEYHKTESYRAWPNEHSACRSRSIATGPCNSTWACRPSRQRFLRLRVPTWMPCSACHSYMSRAMACEVS